MVNRAPHYAPYVVFSLLAHAALGLCFAAGLISSLDWRRLPDLTPNAEPLTLTMLEADPSPPPKTSFFPTLDSQQTDKPPENTPLESDHDTALRSQEKGQKENSPLPQQTGSPQSSIAYQDSPQINPRQRNPAPAQTRAQETPSSPAPQPKPQVEPKPAELSKEEGLTFRPKESPQPDPQQKTPPSPNQKEQNPSQAQPPPSPAVPYQRRTEMEGGRTASIGSASPAAKNTPVGRYKSKVYGAIGSLWYLKVAQNQTVLGIGSLRVKFFIRANGVVESVSSVNPSGRVDILETISKQSVIESGPFEPFGDVMKQQFGEGYWEEITFTIY
jgi:outer membrane biosynthesis protein TonB